MLVGENVCWAMGAGWVLAGVGWLTNPIAVSLTVTSAISSEICTSDHHPNFGSPAGSLDCFVDLDLDLSPLGTLFRDVVCLGGSSSPLLPSD